MFWDRTPSIRFYADKKILDLIPHPVNASKAMPEWFKKIKPRVKGGSITETGTVKRCMPVFDAISQGYIIPAWCDFHVEVKYDDDEELEVWVKASGDGFDLSNHSWDQVGDRCDLKKFTLGRVLMKFHNPWVIQTPQGWSVAFKNPANNWSNDIEIIEGVVDTDNYYSYINFPFVWTGSEVGEFIIPRGTPLIHLVPFKRVVMHSIISEVDEDRVKKTDAMLKTKFFDKYKTLFWSKRK